MGAIFRSAAALGMDAVLLTPGCSDPLYRRAARVSMGTVCQVPWTFFDRQQCPWPERGMEVLRELGFKTAAMALKKDSVSIGDPALLAEAVSYTHLDVYKRQASHRMFICLWLYDIL